METKKLISDKYEKIRSEETISKAIPLFKNNNAIVVMDDDGYKGFLLEKDLMRSKISTDAKIHTYMINVPKISVNSPINYIIKMMLENNLYQLPVFDKNQFIGIIDARSILSMASKGPYGETEIKTIMSSPVISMPPDEPISKAMKFFKEHNISRIPVMKQNGLQGMISKDDIIRKGIIHPEEKPKGSEKFGDNSKYGEIIDEKSKFLSIPVKGVMQEIVTMMKPEDTIADVIENINKDNNYSEILVGSENEIKGIVTKKDLLEPLSFEEREYPIFIQFAGELNTIQGFSKKEAGNYLLDTFEKYIDFVKNMHLYIHLKQHDEKRKDLHLIYCKLRVSTPKKLFITSDVGWGFMQALRNATQDIEKQIRRMKQ